jgi:DnaJ-class molecular chaperone
MSLPNTVKCSVCDGSGQVLEPREVPTSCPSSYSRTYVTYDMYGNPYWTEECYTIEWVPVKCKHCGGVGYFYIQGTKDIIKAHGYELINDFNNFLNMHPNLKDEIQRFNLKIQIYISRLRLINDTFYS